MGCFGDMEKTKQVDSNQTTSPPDWVKRAGQENYNSALDIFKNGFQPYTAPRTAGLAPNEQQASNLISTTAASPNPFSTQAAGDYTAYGAAPAQKFNFSTVVDPNGPLGSMQSYMNPYIDATLAPTLRQLALSGSQARNGINANATSSGAFGDARHGVVEGEQRKNESQQAGDFTNKAFSDAFTSAMGMRQQDLGRKLQTDTAQNGANETALNRMRQSGIDLTSLDQYNTQRALGLAGALGTTGEKEREVAQGGMDRDYQDFLRKSGWNDSQIGFLTQILAGTPTEKTTTGQQTTQEPNNSGFGVLGSLAGSIFSQI